MKLSQQNSLGKRARMQAVLNDVGLHEGKTARAAQVVRASGVAAGEESTEGIEWVLTTEKPAKVWDWERYDIVYEVLRADGMKVDSTGQVPLQDTHVCDSVDKNLGHVEGFRDAIVGDGADFYLAQAGDVFFARDEKSVNTKNKVEDGHITDGSVGYRQDASVWIPENQEAVVRGVTYRGPLLVTYEWTLLEFSMTPIGADSLAKKIRAIK